MSDRAKRLLLAVLMCMVWLGHAPVVPAQTGVLREGAKRIVRALARHFGREGVGDVTERATREVVEEVAERVLREGGEELIETVAARTAKYGPDFLHALKNAPSCRRLIKVVDELPPQQAKSALRRLAAGAQGRELAHLAERYGAAALRAELKHPGVGRTLVKHLGEDGIRFANKLSRKEALVLAQHAADIAKLPPSQREKVVELLYKDLKRMIEFMGRFIEKNPGKTLFTAAAVTVMLKHPDRVLGGDEIVFDADGNPVVVTKSGLLGRMTRKAVEPIAKPLEGFARIVFGVLGAGFAAWVAIALWFAYRRRHLRLRAEMGAMRDNDFCGGQGRRGE